MKNFALIGAAGYIALRFGFTFSEIKKSIELVHQIQNRDTKA